MCNTNVIVVLTLHEFTLNLSLVVVFEKGFKNHPSQLKIQLLSCSRMCTSKKIPWFQLKLCSFSLQYIKAKLG